MAFARASLASCARTRTDVARTTSPARASTSRPHRAVVARAVVARAVAAGEDAFPTCAGVDLDDAKTRAVAMAMTPERFGNITLTGPGRGTEARAYRRVEFRCVRVRGELRLQRTRYDERQAFTSNHAYETKDSRNGRGFGTSSEAQSAREALSEALDAGYRHWRVEHAAGAWNVTANVKKSRATVSRDKAKGLIDRTKKTEATFAVGPQSHDRAKARLLTGEDPFLRFVGVATEDGKIKSSKRDKYKQVEEFLKILNHAYDDATSANHMAEGSRARPLRVCDLGCGNAYLTFGAYSLLTNKKDIPTDVVGVDIKRQAREHNSSVAENLGWGDSMRFIEGTIADANVTFGEDVSDDAADVVLALHACDTATDEAIVRTVRWGSPLALIAPCCHHNLQVRLQKSTTGAFPPLSRHGILSERFGDVLTDALRAHILRLLGYRVDVMEFVGGEHTPRNTLIRAIKTNAPASRAYWEEFDEICEVWSVPFLADALRVELDAARARASES